MTALVRGANPARLECPEQAVIGRFEQLEPTFGEFLFGERFDFGMWLWIHVCLLSKKSLSGTQGLGLRFIADADDALDSVARQSLTQEPLFESFALHLASLGRVLCVNALDDSVEESVKPSVGLIGSALFDGCRVAVDALLEGSHAVNERPKGVDRVVGAHASVSGGAVLGFGAHDDTSSMSERAPPPSLATPIINARRMM